MEYAVAGIVVAVVVAAIVVWRKRKNADKVYGEGSGGSGGVNDPRRNRY